MANIIAKTAKKTAKKATKRVVKSGVSYAKGCIVRAATCWVLAAVIAALPHFGITIPSWLTGADTIAMVAFIIAGFACYRKKMTVGRAIALGKTLIK